MDKIEKINGVYKPCPFCGAEIMFSGIEAGICLHCERCLHPEYYGWVSSKYGEIIPKIKFDTTWKAPIVVSSENKSIIAELLAKLQAKK